MDKFFVKYLNIITNNLSWSFNLGEYSLEYFLEPFFRIRIKNCNSITKIGGDHLFHKRKKLKENEHQKLQNLKLKK